jgi:hypothetical protein
LHLPVVISNTQVDMKWDNFSNFVQRLLKRAQMFSSFPSCCHKWC